MLEKIKIPFAFVILLGGFASCIYEIYAGFHIFSGIAVLVTACMVALVVLLWDFMFYESSLGIILGGVFLVMSIFAAIIESDLFNLPRQNTIIGLTQTFGKLSTATSFTPLNQNEIKIASKGLISCALQQNNDSFSAVVSSMKAIYFGPAMTLIDYVVTKTESENRQSCFLNYKELKKTRPELFFEVELKNREYLLNFI